MAWRVLLSGAERVNNLVDPAVIIANRTSGQDALWIAHAFRNKRFHFVLDHYRGDPHHLRRQLQPHTVSIIVPGDIDAVKKVLHNDTGCDHAVFFPADMARSSGGIGKITTLAARYAEKHCAGRYVPLHISFADHIAENNKMVRITAGSVTQRMPATDLKGDSLRYWQESNLRMMLERACLDAAEPLLMQMSLPQLVVAKAARYGMRKLLFSQVIPERREITYQTMLRGCFALGSLLANRYQFGQRIGLMLPTAAGSAVAFYACQFAGLVPVMLNFGAGNANITSACATANVADVLTSRALLENFAAAHSAAEAITSAKVGMHMLEDFRDNLPLSSKLAAVRGTLMPGLSLAGMPGSKLTPDSEAVVLFTSGSEGVPKGVVLTQRNLVANAMQILARIPIDDDDLLFNSLPLFHSFGMIGGLVLPVAAGLSTLQFPSPLLYQQIPAIIRSERATIIFSTSTFLGQYGNSAHPTDFNSLRLIVAGGEQLKSAVRQAWLTKFGKRILEGYGVTETSPAIAVNVDDANQDGSIGLPLPGVDYRINQVDGVETGGQLVLQGPNVMRGYLFADRPDKIVTVPESGHDTGDIATVDPNGYLAIVGRIKRFAKVAGEMAPLGRIEEVLEEGLGDTTCVVLAIADERRGEKIILATTVPDVKSDQIVKLMQEAKLPELWVPRTIIPIADIPLLATGKKDYPAVERLLKLS